MLKVFPLFESLWKIDYFLVFVSFFSGLLWKDKPLISSPLAAFSLLCTGLYTASWQFDNCVKYQVERDPRRLARLPVLQMTAASPVVLVRSDDTKRKIIHCTVSLAAAALCVYRLYNIYK